MKMQVSLPTGCRWWPFNDPAALATSLAQSVAQDLRGALAVRERASLALSGGTTPQRFVQALAQETVDWARVEVCLVDERWVPLSDAQSNEGQLRQWIAGTAMAHCHLYPLYSDHPSPSDAMADAQQRFAAFNWPLDVCVLGMGEDGHTASLFPGMPGLAEALSNDAARFVAVPAGFKGASRLSFTLPDLLQARRCIVHIEGRGKLEALEHVCAQSDAMQHPIWAVLSSMSVDVVWAPR